MESSNPVDLIKEALPMMTHSIDCPYPTMVQQSIPNPEPWCLCGSLEIQQRMMEAIAAPSQ